MAGMTKDEMIKVSENLLAVNKETYDDNKRQNYQDQWLHWCLHQLL